MKKRNIILILSVLVVTGCSRTPSQTSDTASQSASSSQAPTSETAMSTAGSAQPPQKEMRVPAGSIQLDGINLSQFLEVYAAYANVKVDTSQLGTPLPIILFHFTNTNPVTRSEIIQLLDKTLYDQAGIVATHSDKTNVVLKYRSSANGK